MSLLLQPATSADQPGVEELLAQCDLVALDALSQFGEQYVVAREGDQLIGVAGVEIHGSDGLLRSVAVAGDARTHGVGRALVADRIAWARQRGLHGLYLLTIGAAGYFPRFGFERVARDSAPDAIASSTEWLTHCPSSAIAMHLRL
jgi:N-acetylglutamate synthase-like GNAT family acetyltransferase